MRTRATYGISLLTWNQKRKISCFWILALFTIHWHTSCWCIPQSIMMQGNLQERKCKTGTVDWILACFVWFRRGKMVFAFAASYWGRALPSARGLNAQMVQELEYYKGFFPSFIAIFSGCEGSFLYPFLGSHHSFVLHWEVKGVPGSTANDGANNYCSRLPL